MARNGAGVYSVVNTFSSGATITASSHNGNWSDLTTEMTNSIAADGQTTITGALKGAVGSVGAPSYSFSTDLDSGMYHIGANNIGLAVNGAKVLDIATAGLSVTGTLTLSSGLTTANIADANVTYAKIQNVADQRLIGNFTGGAAAPSEYSIPAATISSTTIKLPFAPPAAFKNLSIKVATNTTVTVAADYVVTTDGTAFQTTAVSSTINMATTGADALDTGTIASATWYAIWVVAKSDGTTKCVASTSSSAPTMPSGYTYKARIGWVRTASGSAQLIGTWQFGRKVRYVVGLAQCTALPQMISASSGSISVPTWTSVAVASYVPTTASVIAISLQAVGAASTSGAMAAPNSSYGAYNSTTNAPPLSITNAGASGITMSAQGDFIIESSNIYYASNLNSFTALYCCGWEDNV